MKWIWIGGVVGQCSVEERSAGEKLRDRGVKNVLFDSIDDLESSRIGR